MTAVTRSQAVVAVDVKGVPLPGILIEVVGVELDDGRLRIARARAHACVVPTPARR